MKLSFKLIAVLLFVFTIISCKNNSTESSDKTSTSQNTQLETAGNDKSMSETAETKSNPVEKFVGRYSVKDGGPNVVEVLSDGRVIYNCEGNKRFLGNISIISDNAFMIDYLDPSDCIYVGDNTPIFRIVDGVEKNYAWTSGGQYVRYLVYDIQEKRIYTEGYSKYKNRDIAEVEYFKMIH